MTKYDLSWIVFIQRRTNVLDSSVFIPGPLRRALLQYKSVHKSLLWHPCGHHLGPCRLLFELLTLLGINPGVRLHARIPIIIQNGVDPVSHTQHGTVPEFLPDRCLDQIVCLHITGRRRFVKDQDSAFPEQGASQTHQLTLTDTTGKGKTVQPRDYDYTVPKSS